MKKAAIFIALCLLSLGFNSIRSLAQEAPQNFVVFEEFVSPSDVPAYLKAQTKANELWTKHDFDTPIYSYRNDDNAFYWVVPLISFASLDTVYQEMISLVKTLKEEEGFDVDQEFRDLYHGRQWIIRWMPELSYHPDGNAAQSFEKPYTEWSFCYLKAGHEKEAGEAIKKYIDFYDGVDDSYEWDTYVTLLGDDTPVWILMTRSESPLALTKIESDLSGKYKDDFEEMWTNFTQHVRRMENKTGWFLPELSNLPNAFE